MLITCGFFVYGSKYRRSTTPFTSRSAKRFEQEPPTLLVVSRIRHYPTDACV